MATENDKTQCSICNNEEDTYECKGCSQIFCFNHLTDHREIINKEFNQIEDDYNSFRQTIFDQQEDPLKRSLIQKVDQWEEEAINQIKQAAKQYRQELINYTNKFLLQIENKLNDITNELKQIRKKNKLNGVNLKKFKESLNELREELDKSSNISIKQESSTFLNKSSVILQFDKDTKRKQEGITKAGGNSQGNQLNQLHYPEGISIDDDQTIYIADWGNHRIIEWKCDATNGQIVAGGNGEGNQTNQLNGPTDIIIDKENNSLIISDRRNRRIIQWSRQNDTKNGEIIIEDIDCFGLTIDKDGSIYVSDTGKNEVRQWKRGDKDGTIVAGGNGKGNDLNQLNFPTFIFVDEDYSLYVSDSDNHRVVKWVKDAKEGIVVAGGNGKGDCLTQLCYPNGVIVDQLDQIYVADGGNHRVMRWCKEAKEEPIVVGGNGDEEKEQSNRFNCPSGLSFDREGNLYVADCRNDRIQKYEIN